MQEISTDDKKVQEKQPFCDDTNEAGDVIRRDEGFRPTSRCLDENESHTRNMLKTEKRNVKADEVSSNMILWNDLCKTYAEICMDELASQMKGHPSVGPYLGKSQFGNLEDNNKHKEEIAKKITLSRIPGDPLPNFGPKTLKNTELFKTIMANGRDKGIAGLELWKMWNCRFPCYLPISYYTMDCYSLYSSYDVEKMWASVKNLLLSNQKFGNDFWYKHSKGLELGSEFLDGDLKLSHCQSAEAFILEPWILVQLPFHPVLLHQWLVVVLAESLKFEVIITEFFVLLLPRPSFPDIIRTLRPMLSKLKDSLDKCFDFLQNLTNLKIKDADYKNICTLIEEMLPILEFVTSKRCKDMVNCLKRKIWHEPNPYYIERVPKNEPPLCRDYIYNLEFWIAPKARNAFGQSERTDRLQVLTLSSVWKDFLVSSQGVMGAIVDSKMLDGPYVDKQTNCLLYEKDIKLLSEPYAQHLFFAEICKSFDDMKEQDRGILGYILTLQAQVKGKEGLLQMIYHLSPIQGGKPQFIDIDGPDFDLKDIHKAFSDIVDYDGNKWKFSNMLEQLSRDLHFQKKRLEIMESSPVPSLQMSAVELALHFENQRSGFQICKNVLVVSEKVGKVTLCPDWLLVQHLLPCQVATLLHVKQDPHLDIKSKEFFLNFVHGLVSSYENYPAWMVSSCWENRVVYREFSSGEVDFDPLDGFSLPKLFLYSTTSKIMWQKTTQQFPAALLVKLEKFVLCLDDLLKFEMDETLWRAKQTMWRFLCRLQFVLEKQVVQPDQIGLEENQENLHWLCILLALNAYESFYFKENVPRIIPEIELPSLAAEIFYFCSQCNELSLHRLKKLKPGVLSSVVEAKKIFKKEAAILTKEQLFGIIIHMSLNFNRVCEKSAAKRRAESIKPCPFDPLDIAYYSYLHNDLWKLKQTTSALLRNQEGVDLSLVSHKYASEKAPVCYAIAMHEVSRKKKVKMSHPGQYTFCPIIHCRWCGLVECEEFRVCHLCQEDPGYPDWNTFCSTKCEEAALEKHHTEEHANYLMIQLGMDV